MKASQNCIELQSFKKYPKSWLLLATVVFLGTMAVMGGHFADAATRPLWWKLWQAAQYIAIVVIVTGWCYLWLGQKKNKK